MFVKDFTEFDRIKITNVSIRKRVNKDVKWNFIISFKNVIRISSPFFSIWNCKLVWRNTDIISTKFRDWCDINYWIITGHIYIKTRDDVHHSKEVTRLEDSRLEKKTKSVYFFIYFVRVVWSNRQIRRAK